MSFSGDLEHLPIVDIIQLLHSTRKSGTLRLLGSKGESRLVFSDGYITSANHCNNSVRLGQVLLSMNAITQDDLAEVLSEQKQAGDKRQPLIAMLIESGRIDKNLAFKGLEALIVMTIIDILTWEGGSFTVDVEDISLSDEYRYFPEKLHEDFYTSTQNILMDALRIYDEKIRDGALNGTGIFTANEANDVVEVPAEGVATELPDETTSSDLEISIDMLGLDELDRIDKKIPDVFKGLHTQTRQHAVEEIDLGEVTNDDKIRILAALEQIIPTPAPKTTTHNELIIFFSYDRLLKGTLSALCKRSGRSIFTIDDSASLSMLIDQAISRETSPILLIDAPIKDQPGFDHDAISTLMVKRLKSYSAMDCIALYPPDQPEFGLHAIEHGAQMILPKGVGIDRDGRIDAAIALAGALHAWLGKYTTHEETRIEKLFTEALQTLLNLSEPAEIFSHLLKFISNFFVRGQTFVVSKDDLVVERGFDRDRQVEGIGPFPLKSKINISEIATFRQAVESRQIFLGPATDFATISEIATTPPKSNRILLMPIIVFDQTIAVIYGDYGIRQISLGQSERLYILSRLAGILIEKSHIAT